MPAVSLVTAYDAQGQILLGKRRDNKKWTLPGGKAHEGESPEDAARRELREETGLDALSLSPLKTITSPTGDILSFFSAYVHGTPHGDDDPDDECGDDWDFIDVSDGVPSNIYDHLAGPEDDSNVIRQLFDCKKSERVWEALEKTLVHNDPSKPMTVYRIQGPGGVGPHGRGTPTQVVMAASKNRDDWHFGQKGVGENPNPQPHSDFEPHEYADLAPQFSGTSPEQRTGSPYRYAFESPQHAETWFGKEGLATMAQHGYSISPVQASRVYRSRSGRQVAFLPHNESLGKAEDEVKTLLQHPNPTERLMALRLNSVSPTDVQTASLDGDPEVHQAAIEHPLFGPEAGMHLLEAPADGSGAPPTVQQKAFLARPEKVTEAHLMAAQQLSQGRLDDTLVRHPGMTENTVRAMYSDPAVAYPHRLALLDHPAAPEDVLEHAVHTGTTVPSIEAQQLAQAALVHPRMPAPILEKLVHQAASSPAPWLHDLALHALRNSNVSPSLIQDILNEGKVRPTPEHAALRVAAVSGPSATPANIAEAMGDRDPAVWKHLAGAKNILPHQVSAILARLLAENPRDQPALEALAGAKAFNAGHLNQLLNTPLLKAEDLAKAIKPEHLSAIGHAIDPNGHKVVDHFKDLSAHPAANGAETEAYRTQVLNSPQVHDKIGRPGLKGATRKAVFKATVSGHSESSLFMVKPYHEKIVTEVQHFQRHPHQGWSEMTNQALFHAGGIGHLHQKVHVDEHNAGPGHENEPMTVTHIEPGHTTVDDGGTATKENGLNVRKIALMSFLANAQDQHANNLMVNNKTGAPLAIDNSRNFQYVSAQRRQYQPQDRFSHYVRYSGLRTLEPLLGPFSGPNAVHEANMDAIDRYRPAFEWWGERGDAIRKTFHDRLGQIKDLGIREHLARNFDARADYLDDRARHGIENFGQTWYDDPVDLYKPGEVTDDEANDDPESVIRAKALAAVPRRPSAKRDAGAAFREFMREQAVRA